MPIYYLKPRRCLHGPLQLRANGDNVERAGFALQDASLRCLIVSPRRLRWSHVWLQHICGSINSLHLKLDSNLVGVFFFFQMFSALRKLTEAGGDVTGGGEKRLLFLGHFWLKKAR